MTHPTLADPQSEMAGDDHHITRATVLKVFALIAVVSFVLRIAYAGHLYEDDGLWFTVGEELLRGKVLYREIYFDKPPGLALTYLLLFWSFGAHVITVRLFTIAYSIAVAVVLCLFGSRLYDRRIGLLAAGMFAVFSTTYPHFQALNTDLLMVLPYTAGAYWLVRSRWDISSPGAGPSLKRWLALAGGALIGVAFQINPKAILDIVFFGALLVASRKWNENEIRFVTNPSRRQLNASYLFALAAVGVIAGSVPFLIQIAAGNSWSFYWAYVWDWGARYGGYNSATSVVMAALKSGTNYMTLNNTPLFGLAFVVFAVVRQMRQRSNIADQATGASFRTVLRFRADVVLLLWFASSFAGVMVGGRFYGHYFLQIVPSLSVIGARGIVGINSSLKTRGPALRRSVLALLVIGFAFTLVRFHTRDALLALDWVRGTTSQSNAVWYHTMRDREELIVAAVVRDITDENATDHLGLERIREGGPRTRPAEGSGDYLFVWGYRPEIYYLSGLLPASRFLSTQPLTGVPADVHYFGDDFRSLLDPSVTANARQQLAVDLEETQPKYIVDELGFFNNHLAILQYPELRDFMSEYKPLGATGRFFIYRRRDLSRKYRLRHSEDQH
jgi:4-amino-4-deoxy-L-arabinose transferase-like glycosyltransferase